MPSCVYAGAENRSFCLLLSSHKNYIIEYYVELITLVVLVNEKM